ncbi:2-keto-4-pentenoate hydratase [Oceanobacillus halophilus]|uniref:2-keto-4-pentenoate hydratase n=1 Tax=Oceanobacillus halophilus TaxID=930130 RepID=A0A495AB96_9BACI|nr:2-keto-4-pentenoate hydratase [Oceanobacillus halophilus]RKQ37288.1 2-keto-4-pentenoate hydratase [Oceanobacillus halophilus]
MTTTVEKIATELFNAFQLKTPIEFIQSHYSLDEKTAYAVQDALIEKIRKNRNEEIVGYKISMTSAETQAIANTHEPAYGTLLQSNVLKSDETVSLSSLFTPLVEPELMFILTDDLSPEDTENEILRKSKLAAGIEIPDSRYINWFPNFSLADLLCDNTATGLVIVSESILPPSLEELANVNMELFHNGEKISEGNSSAVLSNPVSAVAWLVKKLASHNKQLKKGMVISSGTFISPLSVDAGIYEVIYSNIGKVKVSFTK